MLAGNGYTQELTAYEKTRLVERTKAALIRAKKEDGLEIKGKMRDLIASMLNESSTNVARMESINNNATPEIKEQLKSGSIRNKRALFRGHRRNTESVRFLFVFRGQCRIFKRCASISAICSGDTENIRNAREIKK